MKNLIQFIKRLWGRWKYRKYFRYAHNQVEYYENLIRKAKEAYDELQKHTDVENFYADIPIEMMDIEIPPLPNVKEIENTDHFNAPVIVKEIHCKWDEDGEWE